MRSLVAALLTLSTAALAVPCSELPVLFIVQDKSGSMAKAPDGSTASGSNPSKWSIAQTVVPSLATQFGNRFRFGAEMFPHDTTTFNCTTGTVVSGISYSSSGVSSAYANAIPGGGTPTAASLLTAKSYLQGQALTTPAYVLLITDGLPNCNTALDANTCAPTTPGCGPTPAQSTCALGSKDCLDSTATVNAASSLNAAGIKVFVVGFDSTLTAGNNKAVLDAIASAGGTSSAYVASNQSQLQSVLNTIALNTATCCRDACTNGAAQCTGTGGRQVCQLDSSIGCTTWVNQTCSAGSSCSNGSCQQCTNACTAGATRCNASGNAEQCVANGQGCTNWQVVDTCSYGELCSGGACASCMACTPGGSRCTANGGVETCELDLFTGCTTWHASACAAGSVCANNSCMSCNSTCTAGATQCAGNTTQRCVADAHGCTSWQNQQTCTDFCSGGQCGQCGTTCAIGATQCQGTGVQTCVTDAHSCPTWSPAQACQANSYCAGGTCVMCGPSCSQGAKRCAADGVTEECRLDANGCTGWVQSGGCDLEGGERCDQGTCLPPCNNPCEEGATQCSNGGPQVCAVQASGCLAWADDTACAGGETCVEGACHGPCVGEFEMCPEGQICTGVSEGRFCFPDPGGTGGGSAQGGGVGSGGGAAAGGGSGSATGGGSGAGATGGGSPSVGDGTGGGMTGISAAAGCNCSTGIDAAGLLPLLGLALVRWSRRRR